MPRTAKDLTHKQRRYAKARLAGKSQRKAIRDAGYNVTSEKAADSLAWKNDRKLRDLGLFDVALVKAGVTHEFIATGLKELAECEDPGVRGPALERIVKMLGLDAPAPSSEPHSYIVGAIPIERIDVGHAEVIAELTRRGPAKPGR